MAAVGALALHLRDPHEQGAWGLCPFHAMTGLWCPGCGSLRAVNDLTNGDLLGALSSNLVLVLALPLVALWWGRWLHTEWTGRQTPRHRPGHLHGVPARGAGAGLRRGPQPARRLLARPLTRAARVTGRVRG